MFQGSILFHCCPANLATKIKPKSGWDKGTYTKGSNYAEVYGRGNFHYGFEVEGVGLVIQDKYFKVYLSSNAKGKVSKHTTIR